MINERFVKGKNKADRAPTIITLSPEIILLIVFFFFEVLIFECQTSGAMANLSIILLTNSVVNETSGNKIKIWLFDLRMKQTIPFLLIHKRAF